MRDKISNYYKKMPIKAKWFIFVCILLLYPMIFIGYIGYENYEEVIKKHFTSSVQKEVEMTSQQVKNQLANIEEFIGKLQYDEKIYMFTRDYYKLLSSAGIPPEEYVKNKQELTVMDNYELGKNVKDYLRSVMLSRPDISLGAYQFVEQYKVGYVVSKAKDYAEEELFFEERVLEGIQQAFSKNEKEPENKTAYYIDSHRNVYIGRKIFDKYTFNHSGTIIFKVSMEHILSNYEQMVEGSKEAIYIVTNDNIPMGTYGNVTEEKKKNLDVFIEMDTPKDVIYIEENNKQIILYDLIKSKNLSFASALFISTDILLQDIRTMSRYIILLCIGTVPLFVLLANKLYKEIIHPVYLLSDKMHQIEKGEMGIEIKNTRKDEIGYVFTAFNRMSKQIEYLVNCVYKEQLALKNSQIKALQAQINPHFLYNTLEMINWKARMSGNQELSEMIEALSGIMEISIDRRDNQFITIKEEAEYLKNYMFLIEKRFGSKIKFKLSVQEALKSYKIPRLLLQPLIENAISHGIHPIGRGIVTVCIEEKEDKLAISVVDTGQGIEENSLRKLKEQLDTLDKDYLEKEDDERGHIGVANVQRRIQLLYGKEYGMKIESIWEEKTEIHLLLPLTMTGNMEAE